VLRQSDAGFAEDTLGYLAIACNNLGVLMRERDEFDDAESLLERGARVARNAWGPRDWRTALVEANHGYTLGRLRRFTPASAKLVSAEQVLFKALGPNDRETRAVWRALRDLYLDRNTAEGTTRYNSDVQAWQRRLEDK